MASKDIKSREFKVEESKASITETELLENVRFLSHKNMEGRGSIIPSRGGYEFPSIFLSRELQEYGLKPLGDPADPKESLNIEPSRSYFQKFKLWGEVYSRNVIGFFEGENKLSSDRGRRVYDLWRERSDDVRKSSGIHRGIPPRL